MDKNWKHGVDTIITANVYVGTKEDKTHLHTNQALCDTSQ